MGWLVRRLVGEGAYKLERKDADAAAKARWNEGADTVRGWGAYGFVLLSL